MCCKVLMMVMMVVLVMPVSPRPHEAPQGKNEFENAVSESLKEMETAIMRSAKKIESAIEETVLDKMEENASRMEKRSKVAAIIDSSAPAEVTSKNTALKETLAKILASRRAAALRAVAAPSVPGNAKVVGGPRSEDTTTTLDPLDEYCKEACEAGVGGPECDCPDHPIG